MTSIRNERGMTLVELLLVAILGTLILMSIFQALISNQRTYAAQNAMVRSQQSLRAGAEVLFGELREVSPPDGDLVEMNTSSIHVRSSRSLGLLCAVITTGQNPTIQAKKVGRFLRGDSARVYYENDPDIRSDDVWRSASVDVIDTTGALTCPDGEPAQEVRLQGPGIRWDVASTGDSITPGSPVRNFEHFTYYLGTWDGDPYLMRRDQDGAEAPLVGPLRTGDGLEFEYLDEDGNATTTETNVRQIQVTLRTSADYVDSQGDVLEDSVRVRIYTRNN